MPGSKAAPALLVSAILMTNVPGATPPVHHLQLSLPDICGQTTCARLSSLILFSVGACCAKSGQSLVITRRCTLLNCS